MVRQDVSYNLLDAGQETTSRLLAALLVILANDARVLQKLRDEHAVGAGASPLALPPARMCRV